MKRLLLIVLGVVVVIVAAVVIVPFVIPVETYKQQVEAQVERATGRTLEIRGPVSFSILPTLGLEAKDVRFANAPGAAEPDMAQLDELQVELKLWPLLRGAVEVDRFVLVKPVIHLEVNKEGQANWQFQTAGGAAEQPSERQPGGQQPSGGGGGLPITDLKLGDVRIENGTLTFANAATGASERLDAIDMSLNLPDVRSPAQAKGSFRYKDRPVQIDLALQSPLDLIQGQSSKVTIKASAPDVDLGFDGQLSNAAPPKAEGAVELSVPSIRELAAWLGKPLEFAGEGLQKLSIAGQLAASPERVAFTGARIGLDQIEASGEVTADLAGAVPKVSGRLDVAALDLNPYLPPAAPGAEPAHQQGGGAPPARSDWSDEPIALPAIGGVELDFELTTGSLVYRKIELGRTVLGLTLKDNTFNADLEEFALYDGHGTGSLQIALQEGTPVIRQRFKLDGLQALPFLQAAADFDRLEGTASAEIATETRGTTERELVQNLNGNGQMMFRDGAIVGINLAAMLRNVGGAFLNPDAGETRKTDFAQLGGTFTIRQGILSNDDMQMQAPVLRVAGSGTVDLPARTIDYRLEPKAAKTLEGQGGKEQVAGVLVPVDIEGPWDDLKYRPDLSGVVQKALESPEALKKQIEQLGGSGDQAKEAIKELRKSPEKLLEGLTGGRKSGDAEGGKAQDPAQQLLKGLFGK